MECSKAEVQTLPLKLIFCSPVIKSLMSNSQQSSYLSKQEKSEGAYKGGWGLLSGGHKGALISGVIKRGL